MRRVGALLSVLFSMIPVLVTPAHAAGPAEVRTSAGRSYHFEKRFPNILARNFAPGFTVDLARKDLGLAVDMARSHDVPVPATSLLHQLYNACAALGEGQNDFAAIIKLFESWTRMEVKGA